MNFIIFIIFLLSIPSMLIAYIMGVFYHCTRNAFLMGYEQLGEWMDVVTKEK